MVPRFYIQLQIIMSALLAKLGRRVFKHSIDKTYLPLNLCLRLEEISGIDLSDVQVHYNSSKPAEINALAYAQGKHIYIAPGQEDSLVHEAWHIVQQRQGRVKATKKYNGLFINDDSHLEMEADRVAYSIACDLPLELFFHPYVKKAFFIDNEVVQRRIGFEFEMNEHAHADNWIFAVSKFEFEGDKGLKAAFSDERLIKLFHDNRNNLNKDRKKYITEIAFTKESLLDYPNDKDSNNPLVDVTADTGKPEYRSKPLRYNEIDDGFLALYHLFRELSCTYAAFSKEDSDYATSYKLNNVDYYLINITAYIKWLCNGLGQSHDPDKWKKISAKMISDLNKVIEKEDQNYKSVILFKIKEKTTKIYAKPQVTMGVKLSKVADFFRKLYDDSTAETDNNIAETNNNIIIYHKEKKEYFKAQALLIDIVQKKFAKDKDASYETLSSEEKEQVICLIFLIISTVFRSRFTCDMSYQLFLLLVENTNEKSIIKNLKNYKFPMKSLILVTNKLKNNSSNKVEKCLCYTKKGMMFIRKEDCAAAKYQALFNLINKSINNATNINLINLSGTDNKSNLITILAFLKKYLVECEMLKIPKSDIKICFPLLPRTDFRSMFKIMSENSQAFVGEIFSNENIDTWFKDFLKDVSLKKASDFFDLDAHMFAPIGYKGDTGNKIFYGPTLKEWINSIISSDDQARLKYRDKFALADQELLKNKDLLSPAPGYNRLEGFGAFGVDDKDNDKILFEFRALERLYGPVDYEKLMIAFAALENTLGE